MNGDRQVHICHLDPFQTRKYVARFRKSSNEAKNFTIRKKIEIKRFARWVTKKQNNKGNSLNYKQSQFVTQESLHKHNYRLFTLTFLPNTLVDRGGCRPNKRKSTVIFHTSFDLPARLLFLLCGTTNQNRPTTITSCNGNFDPRKKSPEFTQPELWEEKETSA